MVFFKINNKEITQPSEISQALEILDSAERTMDGTLVVDEVGQKNRIEVSWDYLSDEQMKILSNELKKASFAELSYQECESSSLVTITARYEKFTFCPQYDWTRQKVRWKSVKVSFIER